MTEFKWHKTKDRLPTKYGEYLVVRKVFRGVVYEIADYGERDGADSFYMYDSDWGEFSLDHVLAWAEIPEYKEET